MPNLECCDECDGCGQLCKDCGEIPDNCDCEMQVGEKNFIDCKACDREGKVEIEVCDECEKPVENCECD